MQRDKYWRLILGRWVWLHTWRTDISIMSSHPAHAHNSNDDRRISKNTFRLNEGSRAYNLVSITSWSKHIWDGLGWGRPEFKSEESVLQLTFGKAFQVKSMWILLRENTVFTPAVKNKKWTKSQEGALWNILSCQSKMLCQLCFFFLFFLFCFTAAKQQWSISKLQCSPCSVTLSLVWIELN